MMSLLQTQPTATKIIHRPWYYFPRGTAANVLNKTIYWSFIALSVVFYAVCIILVAAPRFQFVHRALVAKYVHVYHVDDEPYARRTYQSLEVSGVPFVHTLHFGGVRIVHNDDAPSGYNLTTGVGTALHATFGELVVGIHLWDLVHGLLVTTQCRASDVFIEYAREDVFHRKLPTTAANATDWSVVPPPPDNADEILARVSPWVDRWNILPITVKQVPVLQQQQQPVDTTLPRDNSWRGTVLRDFDSAEYNEWPLIEQRKIDIRNVTVESLQFRVTPEIVAAVETVAPFIGSWLGAMHGGYAFHGGAFMTSLNPEFQDWSVRFHIDATDTAEQTLINLTRAYLTPIVLPEFAVKTRATLAVTTQHATRSFVVDSSLDSVVGNSSASVVVTWHAIRQWMYELDNLNSPGSNQLQGENNYTRFRLPSQTGLAAALRASVDIFTHAVETVSVIIDTVNESPPHTQSQSQTGPHIINPTWARTPIPGKSQTTTTEIDCGKIERDGAHADVYRAIVDAHIPVRKESRDLQQKLYTSPEHGGFTTTVTVLFAPKMMQTSSDSGSVSVVTLHANISIGTMLATKINNITIHMPAQDIHITGDVHTFNNSGEFHPIIEFNTFFTGTLSGALHLGPESQFGRIAYKQYTLGIDTDRIQQAIHNRPPKSTTTTTTTTTLSDGGVVSLALCTRGTSILRGQYVWDETTGSSAVYARGENGIDSDVYIGAVGVVPVRIYSVYRHSVEFTEHDTATRSVTITVDWKYPEPVQIIAETLDTTVRAQVFHLNRIEITGTMTDTTPDALPTHVDIVATGKIVLHDTTDQLSTAAAAAAAAVSRIQITGHVLPGSVIQGAWTLVNTTAEIDVWLSPGMANAVPVSRLVLIASVVKAASASFHTRDHRIADVVLVYTHTTVSSDTSDSFGAVEYRVQLDGTMYNPDHYETVSTLCARTVKRVPFGSSTFDASRRPVEYWIPVPTAGQMLLTPDLMEAVVVVRNVTMPDKTWIIHHAEMWVKDNIENIIAPVVVASIYNNTIDITGRGRFAIVFPEDKYWLPTLQWTIFTSVNNVVAPTVRTSRLMSQHRATRPTTIVSRAEFNAVRHEMQQSQTPWFRKMAVDTVRQTYQDIETNVQLPTVVGGWITNQIFMGTITAIQMYSTLDSAFAALRATQCKDQDQDQD